MHQQFRSMPNNILALSMILILVLVMVFGIYMIIKNNNANKKLSDDSSIKILDSRFARGEINEEEYIKMKKLIQNNTYTKQV